MENVPEAVCRERLKANDEHFKRVDKRLEIGEGKIDNVEKAVVLLTEMVKQNKEALSDHDKRLETLEHRPNMWMDKVWAAVISAATSAGVAGLIALLFNT